MHRSSEYRGATRRHVCDAVKSAPLINSLHAQCTEVAYWMEMDVTYCCAALPPVQSLPLRINQALLDLLPNALVNAARRALDATLDSGSLRTDPAAA